MKDYYKTLGVEKSASKDEIKKAFHRLAHQYHPDKGGGEEASKKFKEASEAYSVLSDEEKRKQYDMFGASGVGAGGPGAGGFQGGPGFGGFDFSQFSQGGGFHFSQNGVEFDLGDIFGDFFGGGRRRTKKGATITVDVQLTFKESIFGVDKDVTLSKRGTDGKSTVETITVTIPPGIESNQGLRVPGKGESAPEAGGTPGDLIVRVWVKEHGAIRKEGFNLVMELSVKLTTTLVGGTVSIETLDGGVELKIPAGTSHGEILRLKGKGVPYESRGFAGNHERRGDLLVVVRVEMPRKLSKNAHKLIEELKNEGL